MKAARSRRSLACQELSKYAAFFVAVVVVFGCCTWKVEKKEKTLLIVKQPEAVSSNVLVPQGAALGFVKLADGDTLRIINRFGKKVTVTFPPGIDVGSPAVTVGKCDEKIVTVNTTVSAETEVELHLSVGEGAGHGGANMIIQPPGGPGG